MGKIHAAGKFAVLRAQDTVKFVVKDYEDLCRARDVIREYDLTEKCHVYLSPVYGQIELENNCKLYERQPPERCEYAATDA